MKQKSSCNYSYSRNWILLSKILYIHFITERNQEVKGIFHWSTYSSKCIICYSAYLTELDIRLLLIHTHFCKANYTIDITLYRHKICFCISLHIHSTKNSASESLLPQTGLQVLYFSLTFWTMNHFHKIGYISHELYVKQVLKWININKNQNHLTIFHQN